MAVFSRRYALAPSLALLILTVVTIVFVRPVSSAQDDFTLSSPRLQAGKLTMKVDEEVDVAIAFTTTPEPGTEITQVEPPATDEFIQITPTASGVKLKALKSAPSLNLTFTFKGKRKDIKVTIIPKVDASNITVVQPTDFPSLTSGTEQTPKTITQNIPFDLALGKIEGKEAAELVKLESGDNKNLRVLFENGHWVLTGLQPGPATVEVKDKVSDASILSLKFNVQEAAQSIELVGTANIRLKEPKQNVSAEPKPLEEIFAVRGAAGNKFSLADALKTGDPRIKIEPLETAEFRIDPTARQLFPKRAGTNQFNVTSVDTKFKQTFYVTVEPVPSLITFNPALPVVIKGESLSVIATVLDKDGKPQHGRQVKWVSADPNRLAVVTDNNNVVQLIGLEGGDKPVKITAKVVDDEAVTQDLNVFVRGRDQVMGFTALTIRLDLIDEQMGRDLFGKKTVDDFYVAKVRLYNNLRNGSGENIGDSILVYSESLEANISLQKRCDGTNKSPECQQNRDHWIPLTECDISVIRGLSQTVPFVTASGQPLPPPPASPQCLLNTPFPVPTPTPAAPPTVAPATNASASPTPTPAPTPPLPTVDPNFPGRYRPYTFEMVANTHDRRDERSLRSRSLLIANSLGSMVSFITSIAVPGPSSDLPLGLEKYQNLFIPSFEKLFPSLREAQRINLITQTMKPLEEVPYGSDITRIIFFPKKPLKGVLPGYVVRFTGISTYNLSAEVAIIKKTVTQR